MSEIFRTAYVYVRNIPEGWLLGAVSRNWKIDTKDRFGLLLVACKDAIGNVSVRGEKICLQWKIFVRLICALPKTSIEALMNDVRKSLINILAKRDLI